LPKPIDEARSYREFVQVPLAQTPRILASTTEPRLIIPIPCRISAPGALGGPLFDVSLFAQGKGGTNPKNEAKELFRRREQ
jgi:hypothetical protein